VTDQTSGGDKDKPNQSISQGSLAADVGKVTANKAINKKDQTHSAGQYANNPSKLVWRILETPWRWWNALKETANTNRAIAVATMFIAGATCIYTYYAGKQSRAMRGQLEEMQRQLKDTRAFESARLVSDFSATASPEQPIHVQGSFKIRNAGNTVASDIFIQTGNGVSRAPPRFPNTPPTPNANGPSLAPSSPPLEVPFDFAWGTDVLGSKTYVEVDISVSYRDIFGDSHILSDCRYYYAPRRKFVPCPSSHQHE
jgi:hypothetical protein